MYACLPQVAHTMSLLCRTLGIFRESVGTTAFQWNRGLVKPLLVLLSRQKRVEGLFELTERTFAA